MDSNDFLNECVKGNKYASSFLYILREFAHTIDDIVDKDKPVTQDQLAQVMGSLIAQCLINPWAKINGASLVPMFINAMRCWVDADIWMATDDKKKQIAADVFKSYYHEIFFQAAYICGGWEHMKLMTKKYRHVDWDNKYLSDKGEE